MPRLRRQHHFGTDPDTRREVGQSVSCGQTGRCVGERIQGVNGTILAAIATAGYKGQLASAAGSTPATAATSTQQPILVNITRAKNELHAVSMALGLAQSAIKDGRNASVFLNVEAPIFAAKDLGNDVKYADFPPIREDARRFRCCGRPCTGLRTLCACRQAKTGRHD